MPSSGPGSVAVVGMHGGEWFGRPAGEALSSATVITGDRRHLAVLPGKLRGRSKPAPGSPADLLDLVAEWRQAGESVCVVVSGDPGFFGLGRLVRARFGPSVAIHPAPSSVALAFARAGVNWDDAVVVSAHGRPLDCAVQVVCEHPKSAVLTSPDNPPQRLGAALLSAGCGARRVLVASRIGEADEDWHESDLPGLAGGDFDGLSVVVAVAPQPASEAEGSPGLAWGLPESRFDHRDGMITKAEVRAVALGKLALPATGVLWDLGAGSGSVSFECAGLCPGLRIFAVERRASDVDRLRRNLATTNATVVAGEAPAALENLPDPDRAFVGGGGPAVLEEVLRRLRPGGAVVATYASLERAGAAASLLGNLVQVSISRGVPIGIDRTFRLEAENPVFVCWGGR